VNADSRELPGRWSRRKRDIGVAVWIAFLAACAGTFVIFAVLDPEALNDAWVLPWEMGRRLAYSLGFLFLFIVSLIASGLTVFMIRTGPQSGHAKGQGRRPPPNIRSPEENNPDLDIGDLK
jgi:Ni/Fe-hydrogenase subunit HybB-like protein